MTATFIQKGLNQDRQKSKCNHLSNAGFYGYWTWHNFKSQPAGLSENDSPFPTTPSLHQYVFLQHVWRCLHVWISINTDQ